MAARPTTRIETTQVAPTPPSRGAVIGRTLLVALGALLAAGVLGGVVAALTSRDPDNPEHFSTEMLARAIGWGLVVGLAAFFLAAVPVVVTIGATRDFIARSDGRARLVAGVLWAVLTAATIASMAASLGNDFADGLGMVWPSMLLVLLVTQIFAPWTIWRSLRRPAA